MEKVILIDADQMLYMKIESIDDIPGKCKSYIQKICSEVEVNKYSLIFSPKQTYRTEEFSSYKSNRVGLEPPKFINEVRDYIYNNYQTTHVEREEADDVILHLKRMNPDKYIIASQDKDILNSMSGEHINTHYKKFGIVETSVWESTLFTNIQLLAGDVSDGVDRVEINEDIIERFGLTPNRKMTPKTAEIILRKGIEEGIPYNQTVILCYLLSGKTIEDYFNQIKLIYMGIREMDIDLKLNKMMGVKLRNDLLNDFKIQFGKYKGKSISYIYTRDKSYFGYIKESAYPNVIDKVNKFVESNELE